MSDSPGYCARSAFCEKFEPVPDAILTDAEIVTAPRYPVQLYLGKPVMVSGRVVAEDERSVTLLTPEGAYTVPKEAT